MCPFVLNYCLINIIFILDAPIGAGSPYPLHFQPMFCVPPMPMQPLRPAGPINLPYPINRSPFGPVNLSAQRSMDINGSDLPHGTY